MHETVQVDGCQQEGLASARAGRRFLIVLEERFPKGLVYLVAFMWVGVCVCVCISVRVWNVHV